MSLNFDLTLNINKKIKELESFKDSNKRWNISHELGEILYDLVLDFNPKNILEVGTSNGFSTLFIAKAILNNSNLNSKISTIEVDTLRYLESKENFKEVGLKNIIQFNCEILSLLNEGSLNEKFDFIFLDAAQKSYLKIFNLLEDKNLLEDNFMIVADNMVSHKEVTSNFYDYLSKNYDVKLLEIDSGFLIAKKKNWFFKIIL